MNIRKGVAAGILALGIAMVAPFSMNAMATSGEYVGKPGQTAQEVIDNAIATGSSKAVLTADQSNAKAIVNIGNHEGNFTVTADGDVTLNKININSSNVTIDGVNRNLVLVGDRAVSINGSKRVVSNVAVKSVKVDAGGFNIYIPQGTQATNIDVTDNTLTTSDNVFYAFGLTKSSDINVSYNNTTNGGTIQIIGLHRDDPVNTVTASWNKADKNATTMIMFGWVNDVNIENNVIKSSKHSSSAMTMVGVNGVNIRYNTIDNYRSGLTIGYSGFSWVGGEYSKMNTPSTDLTISHNTFTNSDDAITFRKQSLGDAPKFECNYLTNITNAIAKDAVINEGQEYSSEVTKCTPAPAPTTPETGNTDNNANGAKAPNTGVVSVVETLATVTALSAAAIAGAVYIRKRAYSANK